MAKNQIQAIADVVAKKHNLSLKDAEDFVSALFATIHDGLDEDKQVKVKGLGTFKVVGVKARASVNVNTGERLVIEGHDKVSFTPDKTMAELVNKPFAQFETVVLNDGVEFDDVSGEENQAETSIETKEKTEEREKDITAVEQTAAPQAEEIKTEEPETKTEAPQVEAPKVEVPQVEAPKAEIVEAEKAPEEQKTSEEELAMEKPLAENPVPESLPEIPTVEDSANEQVEEETCDDESVPEVSESHDGHKRTWMLVILGLLLIGAVAAYFWYNHVREQQTALPPLPKEMVEGRKASESSKALPTTVKPQTPTKAQTAQSADTMQELLVRANQDPRVRAGGYDIVGVDTIITLKPGQTMQSYCSRTLGKYMIVYFQALNGKDTMFAGEAMKVPKVQLRKKK